MARTELETILSSYTNETDNKPMHKGLACGQAADARRYVIA